MRSVPPNSLVIYEANQLSVLDKTAKKKSGRSRMVDLAAFPTGD